MYWPNILIHTVKPELKLLVMVPPEHWSALHEDGAALTLSMSFYFYFFRDGALQTWITDATVRTWSKTVMKSPRRAGR